MKIYKELLMNDGRDVIPYSKDIDCKYEESTKTLEIFIKSPDSNMQTDTADFEAIAFAVWSIDANVKIILKFASLNWGNKFPLPTYIDKSGKKRVKANIQHYMRFLYRAYKMTSLYKLFFIHDSNQAEVKRYADLYEVAKVNNELCVTIPKSKSSVKNQDKPTENHLEKWFVIQSRIANMANNEVLNLKKETGVEQLYDQFPCGLFYDSSTPSEEKRIFNTGYFDLWGVDKSNNICLYELKTTGNKKLGIISELFFYSCFAKDIKEFNKNCKATTVRGYNTFVAANNKIKAYFLVPEFHSFIEKYVDGIIRVMNKRDDDVEYGYIRFNYDSIVDDTCFKNLDVEWKNFKY